jgi:hypothetical protein
MRDLATKKKIVDFMRAFGRLAKNETSVFFTGGSTAVLEGWRENTLDLDIRFYPELDELFRGIPPLKETLQLNVELASPADFIPELPGWRERSTFILREGKINFYNYDAYSQALAKIERGHKKDLLDVEAMFERGMIKPDDLASLFAAIVPQLYKYPAIDPTDFAAAVAKIVEQRG